MKQTTKRAAAKHLGISLTTLDAWIDRGAPVLKRHASGRVAALDLDAIEEWAEDRDTEAAAKGPRNPEMDANLARLTAARANRTELHVASLRSQLVRVEAVRTHWAALVARITSIAHRHRDEMIRELVATGCGEEVLAAIRQGFDEALAELRRDGAPPRVAP